MEHYGKALPNWIAIAACALVVLAGCSSSGGPEFRFEANASSIEYPPEDAEEATRRQRLKRYLDDNGLCPDGYEITRRLPVVIDEIRLGTPYRIIYEGHCTRPA
jgi:hypothetical protein